MPFTPPDPGIPQPMIDTLREALYDEASGGVSLPDGTVFVPIITASGTPQVITWQLADQRERGACPTFRFDAETVDMLSRGILIEGGLVAIGGQAYLLRATEPDVGAGLVAKLEPVS